MPDGAGHAGAVLFRAGAQLYFLPATVATKIAPVPAAIGRVPGSPAELVGLALVDGAVIPIARIGDARDALLVVSYLGDRFGLVGMRLVATGRFAASSDHVLYEGEHARPFDLSALIARMRDTRWAV